MKIILTATAILLFLMASFGYCANTMPTDTWGFTIIPDTAPPYVTDRFPAIGTMNVPLNSKITCHIKDDGVGVNISTIRVKLNGTQFVPIITGDKNDYYIECIPGILPWNEIINVTVDADDLAD